MALQAEMKPRTKIAPSRILGLLLVMAALSIPRFLGLGRFVTADEPLWLSRSANFYLALARGDFKSTYQKEHPGVTIMWAGAAGYLWRYPQLSQLASEQQDLSRRLTEYLKQLGVAPLSLLAAGRFFVALAIVLSLTGAYLLTTRLVGLAAAVMGFILIAFDPFSLGHARLLHLDGLMSALMLLSLLAMMVYFSQGQKLTYLFISALAAGLSWLTKSPAFFLAPFFALLSLFGLWSVIRTRRTLRWDDLWRAARPLLFWLAIAILVYGLLWPAMWVAPVNTLKQVFTLAADYAVEGHSSAVFFDGRIYPSGIPDWRFYPIQYFWRTTPLILLGLVLAGVALLLRRQLVFPRERRWATIVLLLFALLFTVFMTLGEKKFDRYLLPIFGPLALVAGIGWHMALEAGWNNLSARKLVKSKSIALAVMVSLAVLLVASQVVAAFGTFPYYINYYNPIAGGNKKAPAVMMIGWGEGLDQAARYLNAKPGANQLRVASWYADGPFSYFFNGRTINRDLPEDIQQLPTVDYVVIYAHQWQRELPSEAFLSSFETQNPEYVVRINGIEYVRIYRMR